MHIALIVITVRLEYIGTCVRISHETVSRDLSSEIFQSQTKLNSLKLIFIQCNKYLAMKLPF